jgi:hypothetical protein
MDRDDVTGVWTVAGDRSWLGRYYRYRVEVWHPAAQRIVTSSVTDPYSHALPSTRHTACWSTWPTRH